MIMILINKISLVVICFSLLWLIIHPKIKLPFYIDALAMLGSIGAAASLLNPVYYNYVPANTLFRLVIAILASIAVFRQYERSKNQ